MKQAFILCFFNWLFPADTFCRCYMADPQSAGTTPIEATACNRLKKDTEEKQECGAKQQAGLPICVLPASRIHHVREHILSLNERDRYMRFGFQATDEQINHYVDRIDFEHDEVFGICDKESRLIGIAHLSYNTVYDQNHKAVDSVAEFGVSVNASARGLGLGGRLFAYSAKRAADKGINRMFIHTINKNIPMIKIIKRSGAEIFRDGGDVDAYLALPANNAWLSMRASAEALPAESYGIEVELSGLKATPSQP